MGNYYDGKVSMKPDMNSIDFICEDECVFEIPKVSFRGSGANHEEEIFSWDTNHLTVVNKSSVIKYTTSNFSKILIADEDGEDSWIHGGMAKILGIDISGAEGFRIEKEYKIEEFDLEKSIKRRYKVVLEETSDMNEFDFREVKSIINDENDNDNNL